MVIKMYGDEWRFFKAIIGTQILNRQSPSFPRLPRIFKIKVKGHRKFVNFSTESKK